MTKYLLLGVFAATSLFAQQDADIPPKFQDKIDEEVYQRLRSDYLNLLRGLPADPSLRANAVKQMQKQMQTMRARSTNSAVTLNPAPNAPTGPVWTPLGPSPIPNGQVTNSLPVTGRVTAFAIDPTNDQVVYLGTAQGGIYRSSNGGSTWTQIFDQAETSAIGSLAIAPSNHSILFVGTGEANGSCDSYAGVGLYRIDNADTTATLAGPINPIRNYTDGSGNPQSGPAFQGRSISSIVVHPTDPSIVWVGEVGGIEGIGCQFPFNGLIPPAGQPGLYRLTNATGPPASVAVQKIAVTAAGAGYDTPNTGSRNVDSVVMEPGNPDNLTVWINGTASAGDGGIYRSTNATSPVPTFTQVFVTTLSSVRGIFAIYKQGANPAVIYVADGEGSTGGLRVSTDGGATWSALLAAANGFCGGQCWYNIGIDVVPGPSPSVSDDIVVLGGNVAGGTTKLFAKSTNGGATFTESSTGLHADTHFIRIDPTNSNIIFHGDDGGIFKSTDGGVTWSSLNNMQINTVQFSGLAVHPIDPNWSFGGTQDNGTNMRDASGNWRRVDAGDGGYALVDRNATDTTHMTLYHTYYNATNSIIGFARVLSTACASDGEWAFKGIYTGSVYPYPNCDGSDTFNGIPITDPVLFYAPMELGPGNPNTVYFGAGAVYRSANRGDTMAAVSQSTGSAVSTIAVSSQDDNYRIFGRNDGSIFYTTTGANPMAQLFGIPARYIARVKFDPNNKQTAYVSLGGYSGGTAASQSHIWKVTNLSTTPVVTAINSGLPDVPVNAFAVDPTNSLNLFAGTDIGVYNSTNGGLTWLPFGTGLPVVAVFGMEIQAPSRTLRIATHGRGMWNIPIGTTTVQVTVGTNVSGLSFTVDAATYTSTQTLTWNAGDQHTITVTSPQAGTAGTQYTFTQWSDGTTATTDTVTASASTTSYTATFKTQYLLTTAVNPANSGTVSPASGTFYDSGSVVNVGATANTGYSFNGWTGPVASPSSASTTVTMSAPVSITANFASLQGGPVISNVQTVTVGGNSEIIAWTTDQPSTSQVNYGTTANYGSSSPLNGNLVTSHSVTLSNLTPNTTYDFDVVSATTKSPNSTFTTTPFVGYVAFWGINNSGVTISWSTDVPATTLVAYGTTTALGQVSPVQPALTNSHGVTLTGLNSGTTYFFQALSTTAAGNIGGSTIYSFTTTGQAASPAPVISNVAVSAVTTTSATIFWTTDQASSSQVKFGPTASYGSSSPLNSSLVTSHSVTLTGLTPGTTYDYDVVSTNSAGTSGMSTNYTFATTSTTATPPVISNIQTSVTSTTATITWNTDQPANSAVNYSTGSTTASKTDPSYLTVHSLTLTGLTSATTYTFNIISFNAAGLRHNFAPRHLHYKSLRRYASASRLRRLLGRQ